MGRGGNGAKEHGFRSALIQQGTDRTVIPELALVLEVLRRAVNDAIGNDPSGCEARDGAAPYIQREARGWIASNRSEDWPFTFLWCCLMLDIDPGRVRKFVASYTRPQSRHNGISPANGTSAYRTIIRIKDSHTAEEYELPELKRA